jgi:acyl-CoA reductase-like NAD-dependent aldehyde dehydrogenase
VLPSSALLRRLRSPCGAAIARELTLQIGRPIRYAPNEVRGMLERARYMIAIAPTALADVDAWSKAGFQRFMRREPLGVVLTVAAWNYPYLIAVNSVVPALMAGNAVILKHSAQTPLCAERFAQCLEAAGLPAGVFQVLHMAHADTERVIADPRIDFVAFTGSVAGGHAVQHAAAERFIGLGLELGGCDPVYVRHGRQSQSRHREHCRWRLFQFRAVLLRPAARVCAREPV